MFRNSKTFHNVFCMMFHNDLLFFVTIFDAWLLFVSRHMFLAKILSVFPLFLNLHLQCAFHWLKWHSKKEIPLPAQQLRQHDLNKQRRVSTQLDFPDVEDQHLVPFRDSFLLSLTWTILSLIFLCLASIVKMALSSTPTAPSLPASRVSNQRYSLSSITQRSVVASTTTTTLHFLPRRETKEMTRHIDEKREKLKKTMNTRSRLGIIILGRHLIFVSWLTWVTVWSHLKVEIKISPPPRKSVFYFYFTES